MRLAISPLCALIISACIAVPAIAKLPPPSDEAKAKAAEAAAKSAWTDKVGGYQLCQAMNRTADYYRKTEMSAGKEAPAAVDTPACADPGPFAAPVVAAKPLEAAGAHSPTTMATSPPSSKATAAEIQGQPKK
jgi:hypothetical protein